MAPFYWSTRTPAVLHGAAPYSSATDAPVRHMADVCAKLWIHFHLNGPCVQAHMQAWVQSQAIHFQRPWSQPQCPIGLICKPVGGVLCKRVCCKLQCIVSPNCLLQTCATPSCSIPTDPPLSPFPMCTPSVAPIYWKCTCARATFTQRRSEK